MTSPTIVVDSVAIGDLRLDPFNPRRISDGQLEALTRSIQRFGLVDPIIVRRQDAAVIGGHQRLVAARRLGFSHVPVIFLDISAEQAKVLNLALNRISGSWDQELLARLLSDLQDVPDADIGLTGFEDDEIAKLLKTLEARENASGIETFDVEAALAAARADTRIVRGDIWQLGGHRIMCGDSAESGDVARLMGTQVASVMVTDPPYGVDYEGDAYFRPTKRKRPLVNDDMGSDQAEFWTEAFGHWPLEGDAYIFSPSGPLISKLCASIEAAGITHHQWLIWVKQKLVMGRAHYHYRHEHIFYGWKGRTTWNRSRTEDSVWEADRAMASPGHPTAKPLALCQRAIENSSQPNDVVIDGFLGSGTTLIAADRTGRRCYGMEIEPTYCRVAIARWEAFSGEKAEREA